MPFNNEKQVTFYPTYGYRQGDDWHIPMRIWVREPADFPLRLASKFIRRVLRNKAGLDALTPVQKDLFQYRAEAFIADRESREHVQFSFTHDPEQMVFSLTGTEGRSKTDFNGLLEGTLVLTAEKVAQLMAAQSEADPWLTLHAVSPKHRGAVKLG